MVVIISAMVQPTITYICRDSTWPPGFAGGPKIWSFNARASGTPKITNGMNFRTCFVSESFESFSAVGSAGDRSCQGETVELLEDGAAAKGFLHRLHVLASAKLTRPQDGHLMLFISLTRIS